MNSRNNDGLVLMKKTPMSIVNYEYHLGNYGEGTQENVDFCKKDAILYFMMARPEKFAHSLINRIKRSGSGCMHEFFTFKDVLKDEKIEMPTEITCGGEVNCMIYFNGKPLN